MRTVSKPTPTPAVPDWHADPRVQRLDERDADLTRQAIEAAATLDATLTARDAALAAHAAAEAAYITGEVAIRPPAVPNEDGISAAQSLVDELARERARYAELRPAIEAQAKADAREVFMELYRPAVTRLRAAVEAANTANTAVLDLWTAARRFGPGLELPGMAWLPLLGLDEPMAAAVRDVRYLAGWLLAASRFIEES